MSVRHVSRRERAPHSKVVHDKAGVLKAGILQSGNVHDLDSARRTRQQTLAARDAPLFICGALRSGTTLLGLMVGHHPSIQHAGEMDFLFEYPKGRNGSSNVEAYWRKLDADRIFRASGLKIDRSLSTHDLVRSFVKQSRQPGQAIAINVHRNFHRIPAIFPDAKFVHLLRDPRDVARSSIKMGWAGNVFCGVDHWIQSERDFERLENLVPPERILTIRYRRLVLDPATELARLCSFIGRAYDPGMLEYPKTTSYAAPDPRLLDRWKREQSPEEIGLVEGKVGEMLASRGYAPSGHPKVRPGLFRTQKLKWQNRFGRLMFSAKRYGGMLTLCEIVFRRLRISPLARIVRRRIDEKSVQYLA